MKFKKAYKQIHKSLKTNGILEINMVVERVSYKGCIVQSARTVDQPNHQEYNIRFSYPTRSCREFDDATLSYTRENAESEELEIEVLDGVTAGKITRKGNRIIKKPTSCFDPFGLFTGDMRVAFLQAVSPEIKSLIKKAFPKKS